MKVLASTLAIAVVLAGALYATSHAKQPKHKVVFDPEFAQHDLDFNLARVAKDPGGAIGWSQLSAAYLKMSRQHDDNAMAIKAEEAARKSLALRRSNNVNAAMRLAQSILEQHRFTEALAATEDAMRIAPEDNSPHQLHAEILSELGRYDEAWAEVNKFDLKDSSGKALRAKLLLVGGKPEEALKLLKENAQQAEANWDMAPDAKAWFFNKYGMALWEHGHAEEALSEFQAATETNPLDFKSLAAMARIQAARGNLDEAQKLAEQSVAITPTVDAASLLEDLANARSDSQASNKYRTLVDKVSHPDLYAFLQNPGASTPASKPHTHDRLYAVYLADHKRNMDDALAAAKADIAVRKDIYAYDTMAWVLHQAGKDAEAKPFIEKALALGSQEPKLLYHAGLIHQALGNEAGPNELAKAKQANPYVGAPLGK